MGKFDDFNKKINVAELNKQIAEAKENGGTGDYPEIPEGTYRVKLNKMEVGTCGPKAKTPGAPLLKVDFVIQEGDFKKHHLFMNKVLYTDRNDEQWNLGKCLNGVIGWLDSLEPSEEVGEVVFEDYEQFSELILDIAEDIAPLEYDVKYDPDAFNSISVEEVYE